MPPHMVFLFPFLTTNCQVRHLRITVPLVECLIDGVRYFRPDDLPPPSGDELRPVLRPLLKSAHRDAALIQAGGDPRRATVDLAVERRGRPAPAAQHGADRQPAVSSDRPGGEIASRSQVVDPLQPGQGFVCPLNGQR